MDQRAAKKRRKQVMFASLLMCCLAASLLAAALGTEYWFVADSNWSFTDRVSGSVHFGLFKGVNVQQSRIYTLNVVCMDGECMYSCADTKQNREQQLQMVQDGETAGLKEHCETNNMRRLTWMESRRHYERRSVNDVTGTDFIVPLLNPVAVRSHFSVAELSSQLKEDQEDVRGIPDEVPDPASTISPTGPTQTDELEFMDYGLWVGTIACLSAGLLMAVVGALFAIVNTATTPVEAITGVPGLYLWNGLAALFNMITAILWAVQFHMHLTSNVLLYSASEGWSTKGMEAFGYSFWLVVVAIFVHVANIIIIAAGTWEPKTKDQLQAPESKGGNIMLY